MNARHSEGILYGVGVGPGDPELLTFKAAKAIRASDAVAYMTNAKGYSQARAIAADCLHHQDEIPITVAFTTDRRETLNAYDQAAQQISALLKDGKNVAVLCEGDPLLYGSFIYLQERLAQHSMKIVPGISSVMAAAAATQMPLTQGIQSLSILPATAPQSMIEKALQGHDPLVILKLGQRRNIVLQLLKAAGRLEDAVYIEHASRPDEHIVTDLTTLDQNASQPYFAMILVKGRGNAW